MSLETRSLTELQELSEPSLLDPARQIGPRRVERSRPAAHDLFRPLQIRGTVVPGLERGEQRVVVEPVRLFPTEILEDGVQIPARASGEVLPRLVEKDRFESADRVEIHADGRPPAAGAVARAPP